MKNKKRETDWIDQAIERLVKEYGAVPPPWQLFQDKHPYSMFWRMGAGESHLMVFSRWWADRNLEEAARIEYFRRWPPPPRWLEWTIEALWNIDPWNEEEDELDYAPYFERIAKLGFGTRADFEKDFNDPRWLASEL